VPASSVYDAPAVHAGGVAPLLEPELPPLLEPELPPLLEPELPPPLEPELLPSLLDPEPLSDPLSLVDSRL